jgi:hypothetical protein
MARQTDAQKGTIRRVMHEFKHGELTSSTGAPVENRDQAVAIALHEAGASRDETPATNRKTFRRTRRKERQGATPQARTEGKAAQEATLAGHPHRS